MWINMVIHYRLTTSVSWSTNFAWYSHFPWTCTCTHMVIHYWLTIPDIWNHYNFAWFSKHHSSANIWIRGIMLPEATSVNYMCTIKIAQLFKWLGILLILIFIHVAHKVTHYYTYGPLCLLLYCTLPPSCWGVARIWATWLPCDTTVTGVTMGVRLVWLPSGVTTCVIPVRIKRNERPFSPFLHTEFCSHSLFLHLRKLLT
jgi:hypothetical protein